jgi:hypothetical protein
VHEWRVIKNIDFDFQVLRLKLSHKRFRRFVISNDAGDVCGTRFVDVETKSNSFNQWWQQVFVENDVGADDDIWTQVFGAATIEKLPVVMFNTDGAIGFDVHFV